MLSEGHSPADNGANGSRFSAHVKCRSAPSGYQHALPQTSVGKSGLIFAHFSSRSQNKVCRMRPPKFGVANRQVKEIAIDLLGFDLGIQRLNNVGQV
ncbi:hypothetical protein [Acidocella sp.]|uniref:hypothetical protein n=1 Tax=Acidocella sp. TaxID=50710 RepID=UPI002626E069|nr:hypothetical protein [Acidocella sp.]